MRLPCYIYDMMTEVAEKIVEAPGLSMPKISGDGRLLVFSAPMPLDAEFDGLTVSGVYLARLEHTAQGSRAGEILALTPMADGDSTAAAISADGHFVTFTSSATNLTDDEVTEAPNVYLYRDPEKVVVLGH